MVAQQTNGVIERFGRFSNIAQPGLNVKIPLVDRVVGRPSLRVSVDDVFSRKDDIVKALVTDIDPDAYVKAAMTSSRTNTILMPHSPGALGDISAQLRNAMITANAVSDSDGGNHAA